MKALSACAKGEANSIASRGTTVAFALLKCGNTVSSAVGRRRILDLTRGQQLRFGRRKRGQSRGLFCAPSRCCCCCCRCQSDEALAPKRKAIAQNCKWLAAAAESHEITPSQVAISEDGAGFVGKQVVYRAHEVHCLTLVIRKHKPNQTRNAEVH